MYNIQKEILSKDNAQYTELGVYFSILLLLTSLLSQTYKEKSSVSEYAFMSVVNSVIGTVVPKTRNRESTLLKQCYNMGKCLYHRHITTQTNTCPDIQPFPPSEDRMISVWYCDSPDYHH